MANAKQKVRRTARQPGRPIAEKTAAGLRFALQTMQLEWRYNLRNHKAELRSQGGDWFPTNDRRTAKIRAIIREQFDETPGTPLNFGRMAWEDSFNALLDDAEVDPFLEWLEALPDWDGNQRLNLWLGAVLDTRENDPDLVAWCSKFLPLGAVWRTYHPGTKLDEMPVIIGPQGIGKSTALRVLLPQDRPEWFSDGLRLAADDKIKAEALQGRVLVEAGEMSGVNRAERENLKAFLSRTDDGNVRLAYRRDPETMLRRCVIAGSTNDPHCLPNDPSGNRRFVTLTVKGAQGGAIGARGYLDAHREQIWAEALEWYRKKQEAYLPDHLARPQKEANDNAVQKDETLEDAVWAFLEAWAQGGDQPFRITDLRDHIKGPLNGNVPSDQKLSQVVQDLGCEKAKAKKIKRRTYRFWSLPSHD